MIEGGHMSGKFFCKEPHEEVPTVCKMGEDDTRRGQNPGTKPTDRVMDGRERHRRKGGEGQIDDQDPATDLEERPEHGSGGCFRSKGHASAANEEE